MHPPHPAPASYPRPAPARASARCLPHTRHRALRILSAATLALLTAASSLRAAETFHYIGRLGDSLTDINEAGYTLGTLEGEFDDDFRGRIAVLGDPSGRLTRVGLYDARHTSPGPTWFSFGTALNAHGGAVPATA